MKRVVMAVLLFGITSCAVETAPGSTSPPADEEVTQSTSSEINSSLPDSDVSPRAIDCTEGVCESFAQCQLDGGFSTGACIFRGTVCCVF